MENKFQNINFYKKDLIESPLSTDPTSITEIKRQKKVSFSDKVTEHIIWSKTIEDKKSIVKNLTLTISCKIAKKATRYKTLIKSSGKTILRYRNKTELQADMRSMGLLEKTYMENKLLVTNLSYRETEESIKKYFNGYGKVIKVTVEKNKKGFCIGKAVITIENYQFDRVEHKMSNRVIRVEKVKIGKN
ncbi:hypothetical protein NUSPORA_02484 [Nucleospora cyclopteri]